MSVTIVDRDEIEQSLELLEAAAVTDANVKAAAEKLKQALRSAEGRGLLTTAEAAEALGIRSINTVKRWVKIGYIHGVQRGDRTMVPVSEVERIWSDDRVRLQRDLGRLQEQVADADGAEGLTDAELAGLRAGRPGRLPWQR